MDYTIKEIAERADVSIATVSRALNNDKRVKASTKALVVSIAREFNYRPNILARNFVRRKSNIIGLIMPDIVDEFFTEVIKGVESVAHTGGYFTLVASTHSREGSILETLAAFTHRRMVDGLILLTTNLSPAIKKGLSESGIPVVVIGENPELKETDVIAIDNYQGAYSLVSHLISKKGYKKIAHIAGPPENLDAQQRKQGYLQAHKDHGLTVNPYWIVDGAFTIPSGEAAFRRLMSLIQKPEAIFAANDMMAIGCYEGADSFGLSIPEDVAVAGFDDIFVSRFLSPRLMTVGVPIAEVGKTAATLLLDRINSESHIASRLVTISTGMVLGQSS